MSRHRRLAAWALAGAVLSLGAPAGWLLLRWMGSDGWPGALEELRAQGPLYAYLGGGTLAAFSLFGATLGALADALAATNARLRELAATDALTGLRNTRDFHQRLEDECRRAERERAPLGLILIDLDHFKRLNDAHGHPFGDRALRAVAGAIAEAARASDVACRIGGEEFAVLCPHAGLDESAGVAERIRAGLERLVIREGAVEAQLTASLGVGVHPGEASGSNRASAAALFRAVDAALYAAKAAGRNRVERAAPAQDVRAPPQARTPCA